MCAVNKMICENINCESDEPQRQSSAVFDSHFFVLWDPVCPVHAPKTPTAAVLMEADVSKRIWTKLELRDDILILTFTAAEERQRQRHT